MQSTAKTLKENCSIRTDFPYELDKLTTVTIILDDGIQLAANIWMPKSTNEKFTTILEYIPYRKADWTSRRDELRLKYFSGFGYVALRVDIRGTGNSQGIFDDEYSPQEQSDALQILKWIQNQTWSNGKVVIYGKSWGGFNGLQVGVLQPKNLVGIISAYSTDDRYSDDIHYYGGCLPAQEALAWSTQMLIWLSIPPHPTYQGGIDRDSDLEKIWKGRLEQLVPLDTYWMKHQTRDKYWRHGSVCEDYSKISCPVLLIGGYADLYTDPVFRLMTRLTCPKRAIIGPWGHQWPDSAYPGPQIGFLQEVVAWLDYHTKGAENGYDKKEMFSVYRLHPNVEDVSSVIHERKGEWIHFNQLPSFPIEHDERNGLPPTNNDEQADEKIVYYVSYQSLQRQPSVNEELPKQMSFLSPQITGMAGGNYLGYGAANLPTNPIDQRLDDGTSLCFDSLPLTEQYGIITLSETFQIIFFEFVDLFGFPRVRLNLSSNSPDALICVRLNMIDEKSSVSILLARGILNLTHYKSHEHPEKLNVDQVYPIDVTLSGLCVSLPIGCRLRLSLSTSYWPIVWPSTNLSVLTIHFDQSLPCVLQLPRLTREYSLRNDFALPEVAPSIPVNVLRNSSNQRQRFVDEIRQFVTLRTTDDDGCIEYPDGLRFDESMKSLYQIQMIDPQSARVEIERNLKYYFSDASSFQVDIQTKSTMYEESSVFHVKHQLNIQNRHQEFFKKDWHLQFPRV
ncbi:unnamed protein product [Adineta ricciae]|uniref:Xaa-Pro dipeptidyl-peptidase C-terminal domain-containing protein n=1 Tax=Adineta ricciae TaxID=249248 RepID=A0A813T2G5_ADIRI|nr:unnamed protein product [Adineta ricciae]